MSGMTSTAFIVSAVKPQKRFVRMLVPR